MAQASPSNCRIHVIACGVLAADINRLTGRLGGAVITTEYLPGGLHDRPHELRRRLQEAIDAADGDDDISRIALGYGICGRGAVGIVARRAPLIIPQVQDCIALFLGSDRAYREQFARYPGTYYISAGWYREKVQPHSQKECRIVPDPAQADIAGLTEKYGDENAQQIRKFFNSWQKNYQRAAFIDTGAPEKQRYAQHAQRMAEQCGWKYEALPGSLDLLEKLLTATASTDEILVVPPGEVTVHDAAAGKLRAVPVQEAAQAKGDDERVVVTPVASDGAAAASEDFRWGLGIDAGGTYTDVVVFDLRSDTVCAKSKALTTKWDFTVGIGKALNEVAGALPAQIDLVALSTTLATNAIVEGHGQRVGLLLMPPYGRYDPAEVEHDVQAALRGRLEISGEETEPVDPVQVREIARRMVTEHGVGAFAVSGFAGTINPEHELQVKTLVREATGLPVTCGHELSELLNYKTRARTAVLNGRIIPRLDRLIRDAEKTLRTHGIAAPMVVVKGDGSLMSAEAARSRPVETVLSGPAASVAGARYLTQCRDAIVTDIGGTTTDTAAVQDGAVRIDSDGTRVGGSKTHVQALEMRTVGLGGDSLILYANEALSIGPRRVTPLACAAAEDERVAEALDYLDRNLDDFDADTEGMVILRLTQHNEPFEPTEQEAEVLAALQQRPRALAELGRFTPYGLWRQLELGRLEEHYIVERCGLTPTDLLHVTGQFNRWDTAAAGRHLQQVARLAQREEKELAEHLLDRFARRLAVELLKKQMDQDVEPDAMDHCHVCQALLENMFAGVHDGYAVKISLRHAVIGIGAPASYFVPRAAAYLDAEAITPEHADVANAVGAITSKVVITRHVNLQPDLFGGFAAEGLPGARHFAKLDDAYAYALDELRRHVIDLARAAGTNETHVALSYVDRISHSSEGMELFLGREITAQLVGVPDLVAGKQSR